MRNLIALVILVLTGNSEAGVNVLPYWPNYDGVEAGQGKASHHVVASSQGEFSIPKELMVLGYRTSEVMRGDFRYTRIDFFLKAEEYRGEGEQSPVRPLLSAADRTIKKGAAYWPNPSAVQTSVLEVRGDHASGADYILRVEGSRRLLVDEFLRHLNRTTFIHFFEKLHLMYPVLEQVTVVRRADTPVSGAHGCQNLESSYSTSACPLHPSGRRHHLDEQPCGRLPWIGELDRAVTSQDFEPRYYLGAVCGTPAVLASDWRFQEWMSSQLYNSEGNSVVVRVPVYRTFDVGFDFQAEDLYPLE